VIRVCLVAPAHMTGGQAVEARTLVDGFATDPDVRVELQPIDPGIPAWLARIRGLRTLARLPLFYGGLIRRVLRCDVLHVFTAAFWPFVLTTAPAVCIGRLLGRPVILNYRDGRARAHLRYATVRWVIRRASVLVFPSGFLRDVFAEFGLHGSIVPNVVDTRRFRYRARRPLRPVLLSARLLEELYAVENTIAAFELVRQAQPDAQLLVVGDGDQRLSLEAMVRERGIAGVTFAGRVPHEEMGDWFDRADVLVNSSREDNMPHCLIEAFAAGLPVVTTRAGGIPHIIDHGRNGLMVDIDQPAELAQAILSLWREEDLADRLIAEGQRDCRERYSWESASVRWTTIYRRLARPETQHSPEVRTA
jgi:glycosyltransferase involved in cell wall biosynthesis